MSLTGIRPPCQESRKQIQIGRSGTSNQPCGHATAAIGTTQSRCTTFNSATRQPTK